jgi:phage gp36-like protein
MALTYTTVSAMLAVEPLIASVTNLDSAQIVAIAERAEAEINASLARNYDLPLASAVPLIEQLATGYALYFVLSRRIFTQERLQDSVWPDRFKEDKETLAGIGSGALVLIDSAGAVIATTASQAQVRSNNSGYEPTYWDGGSELDQITDPDKVDDGRDDRDIGVT